MLDFACCLRYDRSLLTVPLDTCNICAIDNKSKALRQGEGRCILVASLGPQKGYDLKEKGHGIFTYYLLEGLNGNENSVDKYRNVTVSSLGNFVYDAIVNLSEEKRPKQKPLTKTEGDGNIILAQYPSKNNSSLSKLVFN